MKPTLSASPIVAIRNVSKTFLLPHERQTSVKSLFVNIFKRRRFETQQALQNISLTVAEGEFFGIVGRNGSGKSTLLKLLAEIYTPSRGSIAVNGSLTPFIELGVGFNPELTGRENVFLNGALLGFSRREMQSMYQDIVDFAELERFMDQKLKNYSSGMQVRLAFSIAIRARSDILLIDEVLAVGDLDFQRKCYDYFFSLKKSQRTVIIVTHDMGAVRRLCTRAALLDNGKLVKIGDPEEIAERYETNSLRLAEARLNIENKQVEKKKRQGTKEAAITAVDSFNGNNGQPQQTFKADEKIGIRITYDIKTDIDSPTVGFILQDQQDVTVFATNNVVQRQSTRPVRKGETIILETVIENVFTDGEYTVTAAIESQDLLIIYDRIEYLHRFIIGGHKLPHATTHPRHQLKITYS